MAQSKDLLKQSARGSSAALPLKCHNSGVTDRKRKKNKKWILNQDKSAATRKEQKSKKPEGTQGQMELGALHSHKPLQRVSRALVVGSTLVVLHCLVLQGITAAPWFGPTRNQREFGLNSKHSLWFSFLQKKLPRLLKVSEGNQEICFTIAMLQTELLLRINLAQPNPGSGSPDFHPPHSSVLLPHLRV